MTASTFPRFPDLASELRSLIWNHAIETQINDITAHLPRWCAGASAERRRQAFVGHHNLPARRAPQYLHLRLRDPYAGRTMRLEENDFEALVHSLALAAVCREARAHAAEVCCRARGLAPQMAFYYDTASVWSLVEEQPPPPSSVEGDGVLLLRDVHWDRGADQGLAHVFARPATVRVCAVGRARFRSPGHLVGLVGRFFGDRIARMVLELRIDAGESRAWPYWVGSMETAGADWQIVFAEKHPNNIPTVHVTRDRRLYVAKWIWENRRQKVLHVATHLQKCHEIVDVSAGRLPRLKHIDLRLEIQGLDTTWDHVESSYADGMFSAPVSV